MVTNPHKYLHWRFEADDNNYIWLFFDKANTTINSFDLVVLDELEQILHMLSKDENVKGLIILSAKESGFIAGADITLFTQFKNIQEAMAEPELGQRVFAILASLPFPTIALIHGFCLGGGLELALACRYRIAEKSVNTKFGLPEVKLGLQPGWGGTVRLPKLIGSAKALNLMLTGRTIDITEAIKLGLVDKAVRKEKLVATARDYLHYLPKPKRASLWQRLQNIPVIRKLVGSFYRKKLRSQINPDHYPSPYGVLNNWIQYGVSDNAYEVEAKSCGNLFLTNTSKNLVRVFFLQSRLKALIKTSALPPQHIHVVGSTDFASQLVEIIERAGLTVTRQLIVDNANENLKKADMIIESHENSLTSHAWRTIGEHANERAILITLSPAPNLDEISQNLSHRIMGMYFLPFPTPQLLELIVTEQTNQHLIDIALAFIRSLQLMGIIIQSKHGSFLYRLSQAYINKAKELLQQGVSSDRIDQEMENFGMRMGPIALAKSLHIDIAHPKKSDNKNTKNTNITNQLVHAITVEAKACLEEGILTDSDLIDAAIIFGVGFPPFLGGPLHASKSS